MSQSELTGVIVERSELKELREKLSMLAMELIERDHVIASLRIALERVLTLPAREHRAAIAVIHADLVGHSKEGEGVRLFEHGLDAAHQDFLTRLSTRFPSLTVTEVRVCSLLRSILTTKDIAHLLNTTTRNIETHRYWIRRKLSLDRNQDLVTFLAGI